MAYSTEVRFGLSYGWSLGESGWNTGMDANILKIARVGMQLSVLDRDLTAPPGTPAAGDTYLVGAAATGDWATHDDDVAVWDGVAWVYYTPRIGWVAYIEDEGKISAFKATGWSAGLAI